MEKDELTELTNSSGEGLIEIHFIELSKFRKYIKGKNIMEIVRENNLYKWLVFILDPSNEVIEMISKSDKVVNRATKALRELSSDDEARMKYMDREKARLDKISALFSAEKKGERKGEMREKIKIAKAMIKEGFSVENIMKLTELKREEIEELPKK
jgi:predicted transposase/invertase (TIGR01784 family)